MDNIYIKIAEFIFEISFGQSEPPFNLDKHYYKKISEYYKDFICKEFSGKVDFQIHLITNLEMEGFVRKKKKETFIKLYEYKSKYKINTYYHLSEEQFYLVIRQGLQVLLKDGKGFIMHGSASVINDKASIFLGESGAGKSTIMTILSKSFQPVADDSFIIRKVNNIYMVYSTPLIEKNYWISKSYQGYQINKVFFLKKGMFHYTKPLKNKETIINKFIKQIYTNRDDFEKQMKTLLILINKKNIFFELQFSLNNNNDLIKLMV